MPTSATPSSMTVSCSREMGMSCVTGMSCSYECLLGGEHGLVQVASGVAQGAGLIVADDDQVHVQAGFGEVTLGRDVAVSGDRGGGQGELDPATVSGGAVPGGPGRGGQCLDGLDKLPGRDHPGRAQGQQVVCFAEDLAGGRDTG